MLKAIVCTSVIVAVTGCTSPTILSESKDKELSLSHEAFADPCVIVPFIKDKDKDKVVIKAENKDENKIVIKAENKDDNKIVIKVENKDENKIVIKAENKDENKIVIKPENKDENKGVSGPLTAFVVDAAATLLIDEIQTRLENAAKQQVLFKNSTFIGVSNSGLSEVNCEQKVVVTHNDTTSHGVTLTFNNTDSLPLISVKATLSDGKKLTPPKDLKDEIPLPKGWKKATASLSLKWKTIYSKDGIVKTSQTIPIVVAEFKSNGDREHLRFIEQPKPIMLQAPNAPTDAASVHVLTYTFTMVESTDSKLLGQLAKSLKKQKGPMVDEINKAYIESLDKD